MQSAVSLMNETNGNMTPWKVLKVAVQQRENTNMFRDIF
jgi:hypothetical protein